MIIKQKFLIIQLRQLGDVLLTTPIARILKETVPQSHVSFWTETTCRSVLEQNPYIDRIVVSRRNGSWMDAFRLSRELRLSRFDVLIDFMANPRSAVMAFLSRTPVRISYRKKGRGLLYTHQIEPGECRYAVDYKKFLLGPLGIENSWRQPEMYLTREEEDFGRRLRQDVLPRGISRLVTIDPSHRRYTRRWPVGHFGALSAMIARKLKVLPLVLWGPGEKETALGVVEASGNKAQLAPETSVREMAAVIQAADLHVGNCSAPRHIAAAVGTPSFTILGSTSSGWTFPSQNHTDFSLGIDCQPCNRNECPIEVKCLTDLLPEVVFSRLSVWVDSQPGWGRK